ncbi:MAG: aspartate kinase [Planctomycetota bacterium]
MKNLAVHKFGGTSLGNAERIAHAAGLVAESRSGALKTKEPRIVVASAMSGVTDELARLLNADEPQWARRDFDRLIQSHLAYLEELGANLEARCELEQLAERAAADFSKWSSSQTGARSSLDFRLVRQLISLGELLSAHLVAAALRERDIPARVFDAADFLSASGPFDAAMPSAAADAGIKEALRPQLEAGAVPVVTGFRARADDDLVLLGRGGSDLTATALAAAWGGADVTIWTDVCGIRSADPRCVPSAALLAHIDYAIASEMARRGAGVLHRRAIEPAMRTGVRLQVRCSQQPDAAFSVIDGEPMKTSGPLALTSMGDVRYWPAGARKDKIPARHEDLGGQGYLQTQNRVSRWSDLGDREFGGNPASVLCLVGPGVGRDPELLERWSGFFEERGFRGRAFAAAEGDTSCGVVLDRMPDDTVLRRAHRAFLTRTGFGFPLNRA